MPTYEFTCKVCGEKFTLRTSIAEKDHAKCPHCGSSDLRQVFGSFMFSGSCRGCSGCQAPSGSTFS
jgi:putative FmdB family regulatory protein